MTGSQDCAEIQVAGENDVIVIGGVLHDLPVKGIESAHC